MGVKSSRRPAIDLTEKETLESNNNNIYKKKKKKQRLKSNQSHTRLNVEKVIHRAHSSEDLCCERAAEKSDHECEHEQQQQCSNSNKNNNNSTTVNTNSTKSNTNTTKNNT